MDNAQLWMLDEQLCCHSLLCGKYKISLKVTAVVNIVSAAPWRYEIRNYESIKFQLDNFVSDLS